MYILDKVIDKIDTDLHYMISHTGQHSSFSSSIPWKFKISCIKKSHYHCAKKTCLSKEKFNSQIDKIKLFMCGTAIHLRLVILLSSNLEIILTQTYIKRQITKRKMSGLDYLILDM